MKKLSLLALSVLSIIFLAPSISLASSLSISPSSGSFSAGSTFNASVLLNSEGKSVNAFQTYLTFSPSTMEVVSASSSSGSSVVDVWIVPPKFNNSAGTISLEGGVPGGTVTSRGVLTTVTFKVKSAGKGSVKISPTSKVYLNDGMATNSLTSTSNAQYSFTSAPYVQPIAPITPVPTKTPTTPSSHPVTTPAMVTPAPSTAQPTSVTPAPVSPSNPAHIVGGPKTITLPLNVVIFFGAILLLLALGWISTALTKS